MAIIMAALRHSWLSGRGLDTLNGLKLSRLFFNFSLEKTIIKRTA